MSIEGDEELADTIATRLADCRKRLGYTQQRVADDIAGASGVPLTRAAYAQWETAATTPDVNRIRFAAQILSTSPAYLAFGERLASFDDGSEVVWIHELDEGRKDDRWAFPRSWVDGLEVADVDLRVFRAPFGDAALGFRRGSALLVNTGIRAVRQPGIYVVSSGDQISLAAMAAKGLSNAGIAVKAGPVNYDVAPDAVDVRGRVIGCWSEL